MNKHMVEKLGKQKLEVKKFSKEEAKALAKKMGLKVSDKYGEKPTQEKLQVVELKNENEEV